MGAKAYLLMFAALAMTGCAGGLKRFAPPGIVKYEELEKDQPANPAIAARVEESRAAPGGGFPKLSDQPTELPQGIAKPEREAMTDALVASRDALDQAVAEDRILAAEERGDSLIDERDALGAAVAKDDIAARRERGMKPRKTEGEE